MHSQYVERKDRANQLNAGDGMAIRNAVATIAPRSKYLMEPVFGDVNAKWQAAIHAPQTMILVPKVFDSAQNQPSEMMVLIAGGASPLADATRLSAAMI